MKVIIRFDQENRRVVLNINREYVLPERFSFRLISYDSSDVKFNLRFGTEYEWSSEELLQEKDYYVPVTSHYKVIYCWLYVYWDGWKLLSEKVLRIG